MRFAIWCAVSTTEQAAPDKASLLEQENKNRQAGEGRGWLEACDPYIVPGASRSFYVNLADAEADIPPLRNMLEDARADRFDVLIIYSYDRLGDLADMIAQSLRFYGKQLFSVSQPVEPQDPENFDPYTAEAEAIMRDAARITQRFRINDLRRKLRAGMPRRIERGLTPLRPPFGYIWKSKKDPPELDKPRGALLVKMKDMFLAGESVAEIMRHANKTGILPPNGGMKWQDSSIRYILSNPYYAGLTAIHKYSVVRDPRKNNRPHQIRLPRSKWKMEKGSHHALWDESTHFMILEEMERRRKMFIHYKVRYPFAGLLYCECGQKLHRASHGHGASARKVWVCSEGNSSHFIMQYDEVGNLVANEISIEFSRLKVQPKKPADLPKLQRDITELEERRRRIQDVYEAGLAGYDKFEFSKKINEIETEKEKLRVRIEDEKHASRLRESFMQRAGNNFDHFPEWLQSREPAYVNMLLRAFYKKIIVHPNGEVEFEEQG